MLYSPHNSGPLVLRVPLAELVAVRYDALLRPGTLLVATSAAEHCVEALLGDGVEQGDGLQRVTRCAEAADVADAATSNRLLDGGDEQVDLELLDRAIAELDDLFEVVPGVDVHHRERDARREECPLGEVEHHDRVLAPGEQQHGPLALGGDLADDRDRLVLESSRGDCRRSHRRGP